MKPNFALSLSFEGIRLLHRVTGGWHLIGEVSVDDPKMDDSLAVLRKQALQLEPSGLRTKLIIPEDQIKFTSIETAQTSIEDVREALDGTTPYALDDLVIDFDRTGGRTYIAAVARETLDEAEAFAKEHKFAPVSFVAEAEPFTFRSEVFFGATKGAKEILGDTLPERDEDPIKIIGTAALDEPSLEAPEITDETQETDESEIEEIEAEEVAESSEDAPHEDSDDGEVVIDGKKPDEETELASDDNDQGDASETDFTEPLFGTRRDPTITAPSAAPAVGAAIPSEAPTAPALEKTFVAPAALRPNLQDETGFATRRKEKEPATEEGSPAFTAAQTRGKPRFLGLIMTAGLLLFMLLVALWAGTLGDEGLSGWFGSDDEPAVEMVETTPAEVDNTLEGADIETPEVTLVAPEVIEAPTETVEEDLALVEEPVVEPEPDVAEATLPILRESAGRVLSPAEANRIYAATGVYQRAPRLPLTPRISGLDEFAAAVAVSLPSQLQSVDIPELALVAPDADIVPPSNPPPAGVTYARDLRGFILATPDGTLTPDGVLVFAGAPERKPAYRPGTDIPDVEVERPLTGGNAPLVLVAGRPPKVPPNRPEGLAPLPDAVADTADPDSNILEQNEGLIVLAGAPIKLPPLRPESFAELVLAEPEVTVESVPEEETLAEAPTTETPTDEVAPVVEEVTIALPESGIEINPQDAVTSFGANLAGYRPALRPDNLVPAPPVDLLALADPSLASFRAKQRPASVTANAVATTTAESQDINDVISALAEAAPDSPTPQAIVVSARPDSRPRNFATVVAAARTAPQTNTVTAAPAIASGPIPGGVARAATVENAIRLRDINLIGVFGRGSDRRALVRLGNGRFVRVQVGSDLDGGKVTAISESALNYVKRGRTYALEIPSG